MGKLSILKERLLHKENNKKLSCDPFWENESIELIGDKTFEVDEFKNLTLDKWTDFKKTAQLYLNAVSRKIHKNNRHMPKDKHMYKAYKCLNKCIKQVGKALADLNVMKMI